MKVVPIFKQARDEKGVRAALLDRLSPWLPIALLLLSLVVSGLLVERQRKSFNASQ